MINLRALSDLDALEFDTIIDVRSPSEFAEDHIPGAINLPVLSDEERALVGTEYKQISPFTARKRGAALVFRNAAGHIETALSHHDGAWRPLVYCWRGGQRSGAFGWMLREIGWRSETIEGGYKAFRRLVVRALYDDPVPHRILLLAGYTGTAKTDLLARLTQMGVQTLDLEGLANHRGSLLGDRADPQPSQKAFETRLAMALARLDPTRPVLVEAESSKIGQRLLPPTLWAAMQAAPVITLKAPLEARARYLAAAYKDILADKRVLLEKLDLLRQFRGHAVVDGWHTLSAAGDDVALCRALAEDHYDPAYASSMKDKEGRIAACVTAADLTPEALGRVAEEISAKLHTISICPG
ncbi:MAG: tRNA 2-selenouridine(34) synthase MnmH [Pseudomonadota bacterium]